jgi:hypothetical protein
MNAAARLAGISLAALILVVPALPGAASADDRNGRYDHSSGNRYNRYQPSDGGHHHYRQAQRPDRYPTFGRGRFDNDRHDDARHDDARKYDARRHDARTYDARKYDARHYDARHDRARHHVTHRHVTRHRHGHRVAHLPPSRVRIWVGGDPFFYFAGTFYRPYLGGYVVVGAPIGARVRHLPAGYVSFWIGPTRYFFVDATYYIYDDFDREYVVVEKPAGGDDLVATAEAEELYVYPAEGQSEAQRARDRESCEEWAALESGHAAARADPGSPGRAAYLRALTACLEGRGYTVE